MKSTGIIRKIDELGRFVIPMEMRNKLGISNNDSLEIYVEGTSIVLRKYKGKNVCEKCLSEMKNM